MNKMRTLITTALILPGSAALAHHSDPEAGLAGSILHWLTQPDHILLIMAGALLAYAGHKLLGSNRSKSD